MKGQPSTAKERGPAHMQISAFQLPRCETRSSEGRQPSLWRFVKAALANQYRAYCSNGEKSEMMSCLSIRERFSGKTHLSASPPGCLGHSEPIWKVGFDQNTPFCHSKILESMGKIIRGFICRKKCI